MFSKIRKLIFGAKLALLPEPPRLTHGFGRRFRQFLPAMGVVLLLVSVGSWGITRTAFWDRVSGRAAEQSSIMEGRKIANGGLPGIVACGTCHGAHGEGDRTHSVPRLAGMPQDYLKKQLEDFARQPPKMGVTLEPIARDYSKTPRVQVDLTALTPGIRQDDVMRDIASALSARDQRAVAHYYSTLSYNTAGDYADMESLARGEDLALRGKPEYGVPACISCHGPDGMGLGGVFPPLTGQSPEYLIRQLNNWQLGTRDNDTMALMRNVAEQLTDGDKLNVATYFANISVGPHQ